MNHQDGLSTAMLFSKGLKERDILTIALSTVASVPAAAVREFGRYRGPDSGSVCEVPPIN